MGHAIRESGNRLTNPEKNTMWRHESAAARYPCGNEPSGNAN
jgi:hypothetical protein